MELISFDNVVKVLEEYGQEVRNKYQDQLIENDRIATGKLLNSVEYRVVSNGNTYEVQLQLMNYWKYLEYGLKGKKNPTSPFSNPGMKVYPFIREWIKVKPVLPRPMKNGKLPALNQLAFLITRAIAKNGTTPGDELKDSLEAVNEKYKEKLIVALQKDSEAIMKYVVGDFQGTRQTF